jgi:thrombospondin type 3 repeat protein
MVRMKRTCTKRSAPLAFVTAVAVVFALSGSAFAQAHHAKDSDGDGMPNRWERAHHTHVFRKDANADPDHDGLSNIREYKDHTRPHQADTDKDGLVDGVEVHQFHTSPLRADSDHDGIGDAQDDGNHDGVPDGGEDGDHDGDSFVGTIISFDGNGVLTFESAVGYPVSAYVTTDTHVHIEGGVCDPNAAQDWLTEGTDIAEVSFAEHPFHGLPALTYLMLICPED